MHRFTLRISVVLVAMLAIAGVSPLTARQSALPPVSDRAALAAQVKTEFLHAWDAYRRLAWNHDELNPISKTVHDWYPPAVLYMTPVDALDTMLIMGLKDQAADVETLVKEHLSFDQDVSVQLFEINIRLLGALLTAHQMTGDPKFLALADDLGTRLLPAFKSPTGMPYRYVNLRTGVTHDNVSNPAEIGTLILEFGTLSKLTKKPIYFDTAKKALMVLYSHRSPATGLVGESINVDTGEWTNKTSDVGGGIDSYYEYLAKCDRLFGDGDCRVMAKASISAINKYLGREVNGGLWYGPASMDSGLPKGSTYGALQAFLPTVFAITGDVDRAKRLQDSNFKMWNLAGVEPEELDFKTMRITQPAYPLRPEIMESAYYLFHYTQDAKYLDESRTFFDALIRYCRVDDGYTVLRSVTTKEKGDRMHSFLFAEVFKYLYLSFAPADTLDFDTTTFNTEAHPLRRTW